MKVIEICGRKIGEGHPPYIVAEMSNNHLRDFKRASALIRAAQAAGAHAIKLQTFDADSLTIDCDAPDFWIRGGLWDGMTLYQLYDSVSMDRESQRQLFALGRDLGITVFSSPFDESAVEFLEEVGAPAYKIASFEIVDLELVSKVAATKKPLILSTGMASPDEISEALACARDCGCRDLALLYCVSGYPTPVEDANVSTIPELARRFDAVVGFSDHTLGTVAAVAATAMGASIIEKHFTLRRSDGGPDAAFSLEPDELADLVRECAGTWRAVGSPVLRRKDSELQNVIFRRSLFAVQDIAAGARFTRENVRCIRPGHGLAPKELSKVLGRTARVAILRGTPLSWDKIN